jgi:prevent-host-death family protein
MGVVLDQPKVITAEQLRRGLGDVFDTVVTGQDIVIERRAKRVAVMIRYEDYEAIQQELENLRDAQRAKEVRDAIRSGRLKTKPWAEVRAALKEKGLLDD